MKSEKMRINKEISLTIATYSFCENQTEGNVPVNAVITDARIDWDCRELDKATLRSNYSYQISTRLQKFQVTYRQYDCTHSQVLTARDIAAMSINFECTPYRPAYESAYQH